MDAMNQQEATIRIQATFRGHLGRRRAQLIRNLLNQNNHYHGNFPIQRTFRVPQINQPLINRTLFRRGNGLRDFTSYVIYDHLGGPIRRVDVTGATHNHVPTPHVLEYTPVIRNTPNGPLLQYATPPNNGVRPAHYWEIP